MKQSYTFVLIFISIFLNSCSDASLKNASDQGWIPQYFSKFSGDIVSHEINKDSNSSFFKIHYESAEYKNVINEIHSDELSVSINKLDDLRERFFSNQTGKMHLLRNHVVFTSTHEKIIIVFGSWDHLDNSRYHKFNK